MALDFDQFPLYDPVVKNSPALLNDVWIGSLSVFFQTLVDYLTQGGILLPLLTSDQRDKLISPVNGQMFYNTTTQAPQIYQNGAWKTFTTS